MNLDALRTALSGDLAASNFGCAPPERIWAAAMGELPEPEVAALLEHSAACGACAAAWRVAGEMSIAAKPLPAAQPRRRWRAVGAVAAAAAILFLVYRPKPSEPVYRGETGPQIQSLLGAGPQPRSELILRWSGPAGARYSVTLATKDLRQLYRASGLVKAEAPVPETAFKDLPAGAELIWRVEAVLPGGARTDSPAFLLKIN